MTELFCKNCGGILNPIDDGHCKCENCGSVFAEDSAKRQKQILDSFLDLQKQEQLNSLRRHLWQEATAELVNSEKILAICLSIKNIYPEDFLANFYDVICSDNSEAAVAFIDSIDACENSDSIEMVIEFLIKSLKPEYLLAVNNLIERAFKDKDLQKFEHFTTKFAKMAEKVEDGVYELSITRDVFVCYANEDIDKAKEVVDYLENQGLSCFISMRNLQHGAGAANNYRQSIQTAIDNCKVFLFVSTKNSRNLKCDAIKYELPYLKNSDLEKLSTNFPNVAYEKIDVKYKKPRIQWRLDDEKTGVANQTVAEVFAGLDYCYSLESILSRVNRYILGGGMAFEVGMKDLKAGEQKQAHEVAPIEFFDVYFDSYTRDAYGPTQIISAVSGVNYDEARAVVLNKGIIKSGVSREESVRISSKLKAFGATVKIISQNARQKNKEEILKDFKIENSVLVQYIGDKTDVKVPDEVSVIGQNAFAFSKVASKLKSVYLPDSVTAISSGAFSNCTLESIEIPSSVEIIESNAFLNCLSLKNVKLLGVKVIEEYAFDSCENLMSVILGNSLQKIGKNAFSNCKSLCAIYIPESTLEIGERAFANCTSLEKLTIDEGLTDLGGYAFSGCKKLTEVTLPASILNAGNGLFSGCSKLVVTLANGKNSKKWRSEWSAGTLKVHDKKGKKEGCGFFGLFGKKK
ncbi:MAG: leucine-rich repeat protein [Clostridia bacterium]|nr:leucine-rich repeat protein [Clostridia bacterium]